MHLTKQKLIMQLRSVSLQLYPQADFVFEDHIEISYAPPHFDADYATSIALRLAKSLKKSPREIANEYIEALQRDPFIAVAMDNVFEKNGFINFSLKKDYLARAVNELIKRGSQGYLAGSMKPRRILNEFISANPTGPLTMGNARGAFLGDILSRVLRSVGHDVDNEYYINNARNSKQIQELGKTFLGNSKSYLTPWLEGRIQKLKRIDKINRLLLKLAGDKKEAGYILAASIQEHNKKFVTEKLGVHFDTWFSEDSLFDGNFVERAKLKLAETGLVYEADGATWLKTTKYGDDEDRVLIRSDGEPTYFLTDIAYHMNKHERGYDEMIDIWGADHQGHVKRLYAALDALHINQERLHIIVAQLVRLVENGEAAKMSKRAGMYVTLEDLVDEVGLDVARFFFLMRSPETHIDFDLDLARERSAKNPVFYTQYAYVRIAGIMRRVGWQKFFARRLSPVVELDDSARNLATRLLQFPELIHDVASTYHVHQLTSYAHDLASDFHNFYEKNPIVVEKNRAKKWQRIALCIATRRVLDELLGLMGISRPERM